VLNSYVGNLGRTLGAESLATVLQMFSQRGITYVAMDGADSVADADLVLELAEDGRWNVRPSGGSAATTEAAPGADIV